MGTDFFEIKATEKQAEELREQREAEYTVDLVDELRRHSPPDGLDEPAEILRYWSDLEDRAADEIERLRDALTGIMKPINLYGGISLDASGEGKTAIRKAREACLTFLGWLCSKTTT